MKRLLIVICILIAFPVVVHADDLEIYGTTTSEIKPNILIIFDNSGSMNDEVKSAIGYNPSVTYSQTSVCGSSGNSLCATSDVFRWRDVEKVWQAYTTLAKVQSKCTTAYNTLSTQGSYTGKLATSGSCSSTSATYATGNYINFLVSDSGDSDPTTPKLTIAKRVVTDLVQTTDSVNFGLMVFNYSQGGRLAFPVSDMTIGTNRATLIGKINDLEGETWTPLAETQYEAMRYFSGQSSYFNSSTNYTSPMQYTCQKNYIIIMTDGMSTEDRSNVLKTICNNGDCDGDGYEPTGDPRKSYSSNGSDYLDDVAKYIHDNDMGLSLSGTQSVTTYTVGFGLPEADDGATLLLKETAANGGGAYYSAYNTQTLSNAFTQIIGSIIQDNTSFVAPVVPVSPENKTYSGDAVYIGFFKPAVGAFWSGNLKKYGLNLNNGTVVDKNGTPALDSDGNFLESSVSYWSTLADGGLVEEGGVGEVLLARTAARNIYTYLGISTNLTNSSNAFTTGNSALTYGIFNLSNDTEKNNLIKYIHGYNSYSATPTEKRDWILGDILHSKPSVVHYSESRSVIYVGANDGMLHAFEDSTGEELWGFVPTDLLGSLKNLVSGTMHPYFADASPRIFIKDANGNGTISSADGDKVVLIFGARRGTSSYFALDVTNPDAPSVIWRIGAAITATDPDVGSAWNDAELGQSWSEPEITRVVISGEEKYIFLIGGGYDTLSEDVSPRTTSATKGRAVYAVDVLTGSKLWEYSYTTSTGAADPSNNKHDMTYAIPSSLTVIDSDGNGYADRAYVGDAGGQIWRFDIGNNLTSNWTGKIIFRSNTGADGSTGRKILYPPDLVQEIGYDVLYFGTGDREYPRGTSVVDRLYAIKDAGNITTPLTESNLYNATENLLQETSTSASEIASILSSLSTSKGWYIKLDQHNGEKVLAPATVFAKVAYFTSFSPDPGENLNPCLPNRGTARVYAVNYLTAEAVFNYDTTNDLGFSTETNKRSLGNEGQILKRSDRFDDIGSGIPSGVVVIINAEGEGALIGVGGGLEIPEVKAGKTAIRLYWRDK
ncbi:MAG: VWA domain-containing protein [Nitrospirae bacterium]|nr:VWA domain-containing protein [Nitrospirota bacterium]